MKLVDWAKKTGINYLTAYRWFKAGNLPPTISAYQTSTGTIIVEEKETENSNNEAISLFLKKTVEFSNNQASVEDFAAFVISNFSLKITNETKNVPPETPPPANDAPITFGGWNGTNGTFGNINSIATNEIMSNSINTTGYNYLSSTVDGITMGTNMTNNAMLSYNTTIATSNIPPLIKTASLNITLPTPPEENTAPPRKRGRPKKEVK